MQTNLFQAMMSGNKGLNSAVKHADTETPSWKDAAISYFHQYCETHLTVFPETVWRQYADLGLTKPAELRAYGEITRHAKREGWLSTEPCGNERRLLGHGTFGAVWKSLIYKGEAT